MRQTRPLGSLSTVPRMQNMSLPLAPRIPLPPRPPHHRTHTLRSLRSLPSYFPLGTLWIGHPERDTLGHLLHPPTHIVLAVIQIAPPKRPVDVLDASSAGIHPQ